MKKVLLGHAQWLKDPLADQLLVARPGPQGQGVLQQPEAQNGPMFCGRWHIEAIPLPDASVDVVISNCVINR